MKKMIPAMIILLILLFSLMSPAIASTTATKGALYEDAIFELEEKLALWENLEETTETRELERMRDVFTNLSGASAQFSKGFRQYIDVLISIAYESYDSVDDLLFQLKSNRAFCDHLETVHKQYVHIGTLEQLENYAEGRKKQYLGEETTSSMEELQYYQEATVAYNSCSGWLDSAKRYIELRKLVDVFATPTPEPTPIPTPKPVNWRLQDGTLQIWGKGTVGQSTFSEDELRTLKSQVKNVVIEYGITKIGQYAFQSFEQLTNVEIPDSVTSIEDGAFENCTSLSYVMIPESVKTISGTAFKRSCDNLLVTATRDSYGLMYCKDNGLQYIIDFTFVPYKGKLGNGTYPVYSAPDTSAYRAVNKKASCDTTAPLNVGGYVSNGWLLIQYETNGGNARVGYISPEYITGSKTSVELPFRKIQQKAGQQLQVTDNPSSQTTPFATLRTGELFYLLGQYTGNIDWWYIECKVNGEIARGFIRKETHPLNPSTLSPAPIPTSASLQPIGTVTVDGNGRNVRKDAGTEYEIVATVNDGETYYLYDYKTAENGMTWCYINANGILGWISKGALR